MSKNKKFSPIILIPIFVAIFVLIVLAVSGHLTRTEDIKEPTAKTPFLQLMSKTVSL